MHINPKPSSDAVQRRRRAEARLREQDLETASSERSEADTQRLLHELQVHQIELEMQNEELQRARNAVEAGLEKYSDLYEFAPIGYLTLDRDGGICEANLTGAGLLGVERSRLMKRRFGSFLSTTEALAFTAFLSRVFDGKARESLEVTLIREHMPEVEARIEAVAVASGRECRAAVIDITGHKRAEAYQLVLSKLESTGILAGGIAHDFNNLLAVILLNVELAQTQGAKSGNDATQALEEAKKAVLMARGLTQQLITFARGGAPVRKPTQLSGVIEVSVQTALSGSPVRCEFSLAGDLWPAEVDEGQIGQVIRNLVLNAREAMPKAGVIFVRAENMDLSSSNVHSLPPGDYVRVSVADRGFGIPKDTLPKVFDPYFSTKQRGNRSGMGLGLTICHGIIQKHGGAIAVESESGVGTTFHIHLPACRNKITEEKSSAARVPRRGRILLMDDDETLRRVVGESLRQLGHEVELAEDGRQAVELYGLAMRRARPFDSVLLDLTVRDGMGGQEAIQKLRKLDPDVKGIVMSGYAENPVLLDPARHGFKSVLTKPFDCKGLDAVLTRVMGSNDSGS